jgi:hypothetical protein
VLVVPPKITILGSRTRSKSALKLLEVSLRITNYLAQEHMMCQEEKRVKCSYN